MTLQAGCGNADAMSQIPEPLSEPPLFDQRNCVVRSWNWLEDIFLGPRFEQVQRADSSWIFVPRLQGRGDAVQQPPWIELLIGPAGSTVAAALLSLIGIVPSLSTQLRTGLSGFLFFNIVLGLYYGEQRSELLRIAQEQRSDSAAVEIRESIEEGGRKAAQSAIFAGIAILQTLSNSFDPQLEAAGRYFLKSLQEAFLEDISIEADESPGNESVN